MHGTSLLSGAHRDVFGWFGTTASSLKRRQRTTAAWANSLRRDADNILYEDKGMPKPRQNLDYNSIGPPEKVPYMRSSRVDFPRIQRRPTRHGSSRNSNLTPRPAHTPTTENNTRPLRARCRERTSAPALSVLLHAYFSSDAVRPYILPLASRLVHILKEKAGGAEGVYLLLARWNDRRTKIQVAQYIGNKMVCVIPRRVHDRQHVTSLSFAFKSHGHFEEIRRMVHGASFD